MEPLSKSSLPSVDLTSPRPTVPTQKQAEPKRPKLRPASLGQKTTEKPPKISRHKQTAKGTSQQSQQGNKGRSDVNSQTASDTNALRAQWGSGIYAQVRRHMHFPRGVTEGGTAKLALRIASNGKLRDLRLTRSSGNADLDRAALRAVSRAGRFEKAPKGLPGDSHAFSLSLTFSR
jgi:protein TonB